jgi:hypothetical protein
VDIAFLLERDDGVTRVQLRDALSGDIIKNIFFAVGCPYAIAIMGDLNGNTFSDIAAVRIDDGQYKVQIRDGSTAANINTTEFP